MVDKTTSYQRRGRSLCFRDMFDFIMVDEKWLLLMVDGAKVRLPPGAKVAIQPKAHYKRHIEKITLLSCVARPQFNVDGSVKFDGLVEAAPVVQERVAQRSTKS